MTHDPTFETTKDRKRRLDRERQMQKRRASGAKPRSEYIANSTEAQQPWKADRISRSTWYRRRRVALDNAAKAAQQPPRARESSAK